MRAVESPLPDASRSCLGFQAQINTLKKKKIHRIKENSFRKAVNKSTSFLAKYTVSAGVFKFVRSKGGLVKLDRERW